MGAKAVSNQMNRTKRRTCIRDEEVDEFPTFLLNEIVTLNTVFKMMTDFSAYCILTLYVLQHVVRLERQLQGIRYQQPIPTSPRR